MAKMTLIYELKKEMSRKNELPLRLNNILH
jgi:hypothetical protein